MNAAEILDKRIVTTKRRYAAEVRDAMATLALEAKRLEDGTTEQSFGVTNLSIADLVRLNSDIEK